MVVVAIIAAVVIVTWGLLLSYFESAYRAALDMRDSIIELLREQIRMAKEHDEARKAAARVRADASDRELQVLGLFAGPPMLLQSFVRLTQKVRIAFPWDPLKEPIQWETPKRPTRDDIRWAAAALVLWDKGYIGGIFPTGDGGFAAVASNEAMAVKTVLDRFPQSARSQVFEEHQLSLALPLASGARLSALSNHGTTPAWISHASVSEDRGYA